jgi:hypothetical protein
LFRRREERVHEIADVIALDRDLGLASLHWTVFDPDLPANSSKAGIGSGPGFDLGDVNWVVCGGEVIDAVAQFYKRLAVSSSNCHEPRVYQRED